jgi:K+-transporting ATPase KdpF subunit
MMGTFVYLVGGIVAALLFIYLLIALLKPEWFA